MDGLVDVDNENPLVGVQSEMNLGWQQQQQTQLLVDNADAAEKEEDEDEAGGVAATEGGEREFGTDQRGDLEGEKEGQGFFQAVVELHQRRAEGASYQMDRVGESIDDEVPPGEDQVLVNGSHHDPETGCCYDDNAEEHTRNETEEIEEDLDTDDYTFVEVSVYEIQEVAMPVHEAHVAEVEVGDEGGIESVTPSECVAVLREVAERHSPSRDDESLNEDLQEEEDKKGVDKEGIALEASLPVPLNNGTGGRRKRGRGQSRNRRRNRNRR